MRRCRHGVDLDMWSCEACEAPGCSPHTTADAEEQIVAGPAPVTLATLEVETFALAWTDVLGLLLLAAIMFGAGFVIGKYAP